MHALKNWRSISGIFVALMAIFNATAITAEPAIATAEDWSNGGSPQFATFHQDNARSGFNAAEHILSPENVGGLKLAWVFNSKPGRSEGNDSSPAVADGKVFFSTDDGYLYAEDARTGARIWASPNGNGENSSPAVVNGFVYVAGAGKLWKRNERSGTVIWSVGPVPKNPSNFNSPAVANGVVYIAGTKGLYAFRDSDGTLLWLFATPAELGGSPAISNGIIYTSSGSTVYAVDMATGTQRWTYPTGGADASVANTPAVGDGLVVIAAGGAIHALDASTGAVHWKILNPLVGNNMSAAIANHVVYQPTPGDYLYAIDTVTGTIKWSVHEAEPNTNFPGRSTPTVANGVVYEAFSGKMMALDARTGAKLWSYQMSGVTEASAAVANGMVYIPDYDYHIYAWSLNGKAPNSYVGTHGCQSFGFWSYIPAKGVVAGLCQFEYFPGATYSADPARGPFTITCANGAGPFTAPGYNVPLTGCAGIVAVRTLNAPNVTTLGYSVDFSLDQAVVVAGDVSPTNEQTENCDSACIDRRATFISSEVLRFLPFHASIAGSIPVEPPANEDPVCPDHFDY